jgi:hypothetical protein
MVKIDDSTLLQILLAVAMIAVPALSAQQPAPLAAPVPVQIASGKKVFISNGGSDVSSQSGFRLYGVPAQIYGPFYSAMQNWGHYELVATPGEADLVFQIKSSNMPTSYFQLEAAIFDARTHFLLWSVSEPVESANRRATWLKNFDKGMDALMDDIKELAVSGVTVRAAR